MIYYLLLQVYIRDMYTIEWPMWNAKRQSHNIAYYAQYYVHSYGSTCQQTKVTRWYNVGPVHLALAQCWAVCIASV